MAGIQFFEMSYSDINRTLESVSLSNNQDNYEALINRDPFWVWESVGSDDSDSVELIVMFGEERTIDTLMIPLTNLKGFTLYRDDGGSWVQILDETDNDEVTVFRQFSAVTTEGVRLLMHTTQTVNAEKTMRDFIVTKEIGQLVGYPKIEVSREEAETAKVMMGGKEKITSYGTQGEIKLTFANYVGSADRTLFDSLSARREEFIIWLCGGDPSQFAHQHWGFRLEDMILVKPKGKRSLTLTRDLYNSGFNSSLQLVEVA